MKTKNMGEETFLEERYKKIENGELILNLIQDENCGKKSYKLRVTSYKLRRGTRITLIFADVFLWDLRNLRNLRSKKEGGNADGANFR